MNNLEIKTTSEIKDFSVGIYKKDNTMPDCIRFVGFDKIKLNKKWISEDSLGIFIDSQKDFANLTAFELWVRLQKELEEK